MYTIFFGLRELPFPLANDLHFFYSTPATQKAEESIIAAFHKHTGLVLLTGEPGTGKTMLLRRIISSLESHTSVILLPFSAVTFDDILSYLCEHLAIVTSSNDPFTRVLAIQEHLQASVEHELRVILCIDEAQNLHKETLDRLRLLLHLKGPNGKLFQILLAGQRLLETKLAHPDLQHVQQYITIHCRLEPLAREAVRSFILHRLRTAGCNRTDLFTPEAIERIAYYSQRVPRSINVICDNALIAAYLVGSKTVSHDVIEDVAQNLQLDNDVDTQVNETLGPPVTTRSFPETQEKPQPSSRRWLHNLAWTGAGIAFAWLSSDPQLSSLVHFSPFSTDKTAQIVRTPASPALAPMSSVILLRKNQPQTAPTRTELSLPMMESSTSPTDWTPAPQTAKRDEVLLQQQKQPSIAAEHTQNSDQAAVSPRVLFSPEKHPSQHSPTASSPAVSSSPRERGVPRQGSHTIRKLSDSEASGSIISTSASSGPSLIEPQQRRAHEANAAPIHLGIPRIREALFRAVVTNNVKETNRLLAARAPVNAKNKGGWTVLMIAARDNRPDLVRLLLTRGADVNVTNKEGETALIHAADNDHPGIVQLLLDHGAAIDTKSNLGWTALMYAASKGHRLTVETLLSKGANAKVKDKDGQTASMYAARQGNISALKEHLRDRSALRNRFGRLDVERLQLVKRRDYSVIASLLKEAETKK